MPFCDARNFMDWAYGEKSKAESSRMTQDDFRELRSKARAANG